MARRAKRKRTDYTFSDSWKVTKPLAKGEEQCPHTTKPCSKRSCSMCVGAKVARVMPEPEAPQAEAQPTNPQKREGV